MATVAGEFLVLVDKEVPDIKVLMRGEPVARFQIEICRVVRPVAGVRLNHRARHGSLVGVDDPSTDDAALGHADSDAGEGLAVDHGEGVGETRRIPGRRGFDNE